jgi:threonine dehydratase
MIRLDTIKAVYDRDVRPFVRETPVYRGRGISTFAECSDLYFKMENLQRTGSFKIRGGCARVAMLSDAERKRGVVTASAGNHAQGLALASSEARVPCRVVMPRTASNAKVEATRSYGADVILDGENFDEAVAVAKGIAEAEGRVFVSAYDDDGIITGQGSLGVELLEQLPDVDTVIIPIGGGGLFAGVSCALKEAKPGLRVIGVQAEGADAAARSFKAGHLVPRKLAVDTIADGIAIKAPSERTFRYIQRYADDVVTVSDDAIAQGLPLDIDALRMIDPEGARSEYDCEFLDAEGTLLPDELLAKIALPPESILRSRAELGVGDFVGGLDFGRFSHLTCLWVLECVAQSAAGSLWITRAVECWKNQNTVVQAAMLAPWMKHLKVIRASPKVDKSVPPLSGGVV